jgi:hypothetical protein
MQNKDLNAAIDLIRRWQADEVLDQGQKESLDRIIRELRKLSRNDQPNRREVLAVIRRMSETLWKAFEKK